jgi:hypothetical protein
MYSYEVKIRDRVWLWGSAGIKVNLDWPALLTIRNNLFGEAVQIGTQKAGVDAQKIGSLQPGECYTIPLDGLSGVFASCPTDTSVACTIDMPASPAP